MSDYIFEPLDIKRFIKYSAIRVVTICLAAFIPVVFGNERYFYMMMPVMMTLLFEFIANSTLIARKNGKSRFFWIILYIIAWFLINGLFIKIAFTLMLLGMYFYKEGRKNLYKKGFMAFPIAAILYMLFEVNHDLFRFAVGFLSTIAMIIFLIAMGIKKYLTRSSDMPVALFLGIHNFYIRDPYEQELDKGNFYKIYAQIKNQVETYRIKDNISRVKKLRFYYTDKAFSQVHITKREEVANAIVCYLNEVRNNGGDVLIVNDKNSYSPVNVKMTDILTRKLTEEGYPIIYKPNSDIFDYDLKEDKVAYVKDTFSKCMRYKDNSKTFYELIKVAEYIIHYRGLCALANQDIVKTSEDSDILDFSLGQWNSIQRNVGNIEASPYENMAFVNVVNEALGNKKTNKLSIRYQDVCELIVRLRNKYVGHGTLAYAVSDELRNALTDMINYLVEAFKEEESILTVGNSGFKLDIKDEAIRCVIDIEGTQYLLTYVSYANGLDLEYLNYENGNIIRLGKPERIKLLGNGMVS